MAATQIGSRQVQKISINAQTGTSYTLALLDDGKLVTMDNGSANTLTVPTNATISFPIGTQLLVGQLGVGQTTITPAGGVTFEFSSTTAALRARYAVVSLVKRDTNTWLVSGDMEISGGAGDMVLATIQTVTGAKTFNTGKLILAGSTSGTSIINPAAIAGSTTFTFPGASGTIAITTDIPAAATTTEQLTGTDTTKRTTPDSVAAIWEKGADVASAGTISLGEGKLFHITGTTTITDIDFATSKDGREAVLIFDGVLTLTHHATTLILPTGANIVTAAGDSAGFVVDSGDNVKCIWYHRLTGKGVGLGNVDNTTDANKPVSTAQQTALDLKSNLASPTFTGTPAAPTAAAGTNTTQLATAAHVFAERTNTADLTNKTIALVAGTATKAPVEFVAGTLETSSEAGDLEADTKALYYSHVATARGVILASHLAAIQADLTLSAASGVQVAFPAANDLLTVQAATTYEMEGMYIMNTGITTHTTALAFALVTATVTSFEYYATCIVGATNAVVMSSTATQSWFTHVSGVASKVINATNVHPWTWIIFKGLIRINVGGTISPQINFSANPTGTNLMKVGSYIKFTPFGSNTVQAIGPWA